MNGGRALCGAVLAVVFLAGGLLSELAHGIEVVRFDDSRQEQRYTELLQQLRCLVCQNQPLADSNAKLAQDMRGVVLQMLKDGETDEKIVAFMVARYGNFVRYQPPLNLYTAALWLLPFLLLIILLLSIPGWLRQQRQADLTDDQRRQAQSLLEE